MTDDLLKQLLENAMNLCMVLDREGVIIYANKALTTLVGTVDGPIEGQRLVQMVYDKDITALEQSFNTAFANPHIKYQRTFRLGNNGNIGRIFDGTFWVAEGQDRKPRLLISAQDATHRVEVQHQLKEREGQLHRAQQIAKIGSWEYNLTTDIIWASPQLFHMYGLDPSLETMTYEQFKEYFHPDDVELVNHALHEAQQKMGSFEVSYRITRKDGVERILVSQGETELNGNDLLMFGTTMDVTEKQAMEESLRESERRFRAIFNSTFQFIGLLNIEGVLLEANETALLFGGLQREDVVNKPFWECYWWTVSKKVQEKLQKSIRRAAAGEFVRYNAQVYGANKQLHMIDFSLKPIFDASGKVVLVLPEGRDITEQINAENALRKNEAQYRLLVENMSEGVVMVNENGRICDCNPGAERILGITKDTLLQQSIDKPLWSPVGLDRQPIKPEDFIVNLVLKTGKTFSGRTMGLPKEDGTMIWISVNAVSVRNLFSDLPYAAILTFRDVTAVIERENEIMQSREQLRSLATQLNKTQEEERSHLAREVHDILGQATTALRLDIHWLKKNGPQDNQTFQRRAQETLDLAEETIGIVRRISHELRPGVLDHFGLSAALEWLAEQYEERSELKFEFNNQVEEQLENLDPDLATALFRIFQEAVTNIVKHAEAKKVNVEIDLVGEHLLLSVTDDGRGIIKNDLRKSVSLGHLNMRERVMPWHGEVAISSELDKGTRVLVKIPFAA